MIAILNMKMPERGEVIAFDGKNAVYTDDDMNVHRYPLIEIVTCGECEYADEYNYCKYSDWWTEKEDFCSHGIRRKENR